MGSHRKKVADVPRALVEPESPSALSRVRWLLPIGLAFLGVSFLGAGLSAAGVDDLLGAGGAQAAARDARPAFDFELEELLWDSLRIFGAILSGALIAYHPRTRSSVASLIEIDRPKIFITYTVIGAVCSLVVDYKESMALAIFGLGGLMRFRTLLPSAKDTGRIILSVVTGIFWGLGLFQLAILLTVLAWLLILILDWRVGYRMLVKGLKKEQLAATAAAYTEVLQARGCRISQVKRSLNKGTVAIVFLSSRRHDRDDYEHAFSEEIAPDLQGTVDWPEEA